MRFGASVKVTVVLLESVTETGNAGVAETSADGELSGVALAAAVGDCWLPSPPHAAVCMTTASTSTTPRAAARKIEGRLTLGSLLRRLLNRRSKEMRDGDARV